MNARKLVKHLNRGGAIPKTDGPLRVTLKKGEVVFPARRAAQPVVNGQERLDDVALVVFTSVIGAALALTVVLLLCGVS